MSPPTRKSCKIEWAFSGRLPFVYRCYTPKLRVITRLTHPTMGHPRLYNTAEEKAKACRTNSKKHYDAYASFFFATSSKDPNIHLHVLHRNWVGICRRSRRRYKKKVDAIKKKKLKEILEGSDDDNEIG